MKVGSLVRFSAPLNEDETPERFVVKEIRGDRILVQDILSEFAIRPTFVYLASDLVAEELLLAEISA